MSVNLTAKHYLETQIRTASKEQLLLMLFDGAIRFCEQAKGKIDLKDVEGSYTLLVKAQDIVIELMCSLDKAIGDELYQNLTGLYNFIYMRLVDANIKKEKPLVDEALKILRSLRQTWAEAIERDKNPALETPVPALRGQTPPSRAPSPAPPPSSPAAAEAPPPPRPAAPKLPTYGRFPAPPPGTRALNIQG